MANKPVKETIHAKGFDISIYTTDFENEFISLTDIARYKSNDPNDVIRNWMRSRETLEFLGLWETLHNPDFKPVEFDGFRREAGLHAFTMSPTKWIEGVNAIGIVTKAGRYGGTYAHSDIALEFASWISAEFKLSRNGAKLISISTRGDGEYGSDISKQFESLYNTSPYWKGIDDAVSSLCDRNTILVIRGEVLIPKTSFSSSYQNDFTNPRSFVAGTLGVKWENTREQIQMDVLR